MMKIVYVVNNADAQSIPLELGQTIRNHLPGTILAGYYGESDHPVGDAAEGVINLGARSAFDRRAIGRLRNLIRETRPDIIHMHHAVSSVWCAVCGGLGARALLVKTEHNDHRFQRRHQAWVNVALYPFLRRIICNSDHTLASFGGLERMLSHGRVQRIYNGVDIDRVHRAKPEGRSRCWRALRREVGGLQPGGR